MTNHDPVTVTSAPPPRTVGSSPRAPYQRQRRRSLAESERAVIQQAVAAGHSLRALADAYGVSHETIRQSVRGAGSTPRSRATNDGCETTDWVA